MQIRTFSFALALLGTTTLRISAQDQRPLAEPQFPATCVVLHAPLESTSGGGPVIAETSIDQDLESEQETEQLVEALEHCGPNMAVELTFGTDSSRNAFLLNPFELPEGVSLIVDGGVTVFASRNPGNYQNASSNARCGTYGPPPDYEVDLGCRAFITLASNSGIYGYGVIDGQGQKPFLFYPPFSEANAPATSYNWWDLTTKKNASQNGTANCPVANCNQASPEIIAGGNVSEGVTENMTLYKITIRNPPFHTVKLGGTNVTVWGVKVQAPWNVPNTDGFDIHGSNVTIYDTTVANGDQEIAIVSMGQPTHDITVDHFNGYSKGGITILGSGTNTSNVLFQNVNITGAVPSVVPNSSVNGMAVTTMNQLYGISSYGQALPNATNDLKAIQITDSSQPNTSQPGATISNVTFSGFCIQDIAKPINIDFSASDKLPDLQGTTLQNIHILAPTLNFPAMTKGIPTGKPGGYQLAFVTHTPADPNEEATPNQITLDNVVVDDVAGNNGATATSISSIDAEVNTLTTTTNVYPDVFNNLTAGSSPTVLQGPPKQTLLLNSYSSATDESSTELAYSCSPQPMPFLTGELFLSLGNAAATGEATNLQTTSVATGQTFTLNAILQPAMSQTTNFVANIYGANPGLLAVGSPSLTKPVVFYEDSVAVGSGVLSANGTLATVVLNNVPPGTHTYTAKYPGDNFYAAYEFGSATVRVTVPLNRLTVADR
jgi:phage tail protein X